MKHSITLLALTVLLSISSACTSMHAHKWQSESVPVFRVSFLTPESTIEKNELLLVELETLLMEHVNLSSMMSTATPDKIMVDMNFEDAQSCSNAGPPAAHAIRLFSEAHEEVRYDDVAH